jgi:ubiquinol-cytochrome c reductase cytochrome b subunit
MCLMQKIPYINMHPDNLIPANPYSTPQHIVPEWYFLWVYAILRSIPNKAMGVVAIALTFLSLIGLPFLSSVHVGSPKFRILSERLFWVFVADVFLLTWVGAQEIMPATVLLGQVCTVILFAYLWVVYPLLSWLEGYLYLLPSKKI